MRTVIKYCRLGAAVVLVGVIILHVLIFLLFIRVGVLPIFQLFIRRAVCNSDAVEDNGRRREAGGQTRKDLRAELLH